MAGRTVSGDLGGAGGSHALSTLVRNLGVCGRDDDGPQLIRSSSGGLLGRGRCRLAACR
jgi:hypothetical protein